MLGTLSIILTALMLLLPIAAVIRLIATRTTKIGSWLMYAALAAVGCYVLLIASVQLTEVHLDKVLAGYDIDGDGSFSGLEITPEMWVAPEVRGGSVAADLLLEIFRWANSHHIAFVKAEVRKTNARALRFYEKFGFSLSVANHTASSVLLTKPVEQLSEG